MARTENELRFVHDLTKKALGLESLHAFWPILESSLVSFFGCDRATLYLVDKAELRSMFAKGLDNAVVVKLGDGVAGAVGLTPKPIVVNDPYHDERFNRAYDYITHYKTENLACAPFIHENEAVGVVELLNKPGGFTDEDAASMQSFAPHIGFIIAKLMSDQRNRELQARLAQVAKMATLGTLVGGVVHEIGSPLTAMEAAVERLLAGAQPGSELYEKLDSLKVQVIRSHKITRNLLDFARRSEFALEKVSVTKALEATVGLADHQARLNNVALHVVIEPALPDVKAAFDQLQQVFLNLITNALQAMPHGGNLHITAQKEGAKVVVGFKDDGEGIDPMDMGRMFEPFYTTKPKGFGTGLGLSICKDLVERFGGTLEAHSAGKGHGATFTVTLDVV